MPIHFKDLRQGAAVRDSRNPAVTYRVGENRGTEFTAVAIVTVTQTGYRENQWECFDESLGLFVPIRRNTVPRQKTAGV